MRETRTFTVLAVSALILVMAAMLAAPAQARTPRGELEFKPAPQATVDEGSDHWARRTRTIGGAAAMIVATAALSLTAMQRTKAATT